MAFFELKYPNFELLSGEHNQEMVSSKAIQQNFPILWKLLFRWAKEVTE